VFAVILNCTHDTILLTQHSNNSLQIGAIKCGASSMAEWPKMGNSSMVKMATPAKLA
jgi:hypothetical protein